MSQVLLNAVIGLLLLALLPGTASALLRTGVDAAAGCSPTRLIVKFRSGSDITLSADKGLPRTGRSDVDALHRHYAVTAQAPLLRAEAVRSLDNPLRSTYLFTVGPEQDIEAIARDYAGLPSVEYAIPDYQVQLHSSPNDPLYIHQWALHNTGQNHYHVDYFSGASLVHGTPDADIDAEEVFTNPPDRTSTVVVAIVDTGVDWDHPDLARMMWQNPGEIPTNGLDDDHNGYIDDVIGWDFVGDEELGPQWAPREDNDPTDTYGHGTHCAGIIAAVAGNSIGIAGAVPHARIMALKFYPLMPLSAAAAAIMYAADNGADVISMSWGRAGQMPVVEDALDYAASHGVVLVASAGNDGTEQINYPACCRQTITVGASNDSDFVAYFSTFSPYTDVVAPGLSILSLRADTTDMYAPEQPLIHIVDSNYYVASGTSMSGPYAAAVAAYVRSASPGLDRERVREILHTTADDLVDPYGHGQSLPGWDKYSVWGRVNLPAAIAAAPQVRARITAPADFDFVSGTVSITGSADGAEFTGYRLQYRPAQPDASAWSDITVSSTPVTDGLLGRWDVSALSADHYVVRLTVGDDNQDLVYVSAGTEAVSLISSPLPGDTVQGTVIVSGSAYTPGLVRTIVAYGVGENPAKWIPVDTITKAVYSDEIGRWDVSLLSDGLYTVRLLVFGGSGLAATDQALVRVKSPFTPPDGWAVDYPERLGRSATYLDVDRDGENEILVGAKSSVLFFNLDGTLQIQNVPSIAPDDYTCVMPAVGKLDTDTYDDFVVVGLSKRMTICRSSAEPVEVTVPTASNVANTFGGSTDAALVFLRDIDGDGIDEIHYFAGTSRAPHNNHRIYRADGSQWLWCGTDPAAPESFGKCLPADLDGDGLCEIYCSDGHRVQMFDHNGCEVPGASAALVPDGLSFAVCGLSLSTADLDHDGTEELIVLGCPCTTPGRTSRIYAFDSNLQPVSGWPHDTGILGFIPVLEPVFADLDSDGSLEYICASWDAIRVWRLDGTPFLGDSASLGLFSRSPVPGTVDNVVVGDVNGDEALDVTASYGDDFFAGVFVTRLEAYSSAGRLLPGFPMVASDSSLMSYSHIPTLADLDSDGYTEVVCPVDHDPHGRLVLSRLSGVRYRPDLFPAPMWRYNRRQNAAAPLVSPASCCNKRGDVHEDRVINIADLAFLVSYLFRSGPAAPCHVHADIDASNSITVKDLTYLVNSLFRGGAIPPPCD